MNKREKIIIILSLMTSMIICFSDDFMGVPYIKITTSEEGVSEGILTKEEMRENFVAIKEASDGLYVWLTRNNTILEKNENGIYIIYNAVSGVGYVKINTLNGQFIEHVHHGLRTIIYYGIELKNE